MSSTFPVVNRRSHPARALSFLASRAALGAIARTASALCLSCLLSFFCFPQRVVAGTQDFSPKAQQNPASATPASAPEKNPTSPIAGIAAEPEETPTPDPALAPARDLLQQGKLSEAEAATRSHLKDHAESAEAHFLLGFILFKEISAKWREAGQAQDAKTPDAKAPDAKAQDALPYSEGNAVGSLAKFRDAKARESLAEFTAGARYRPASAFDLKIVALDYLLLKHNMDADLWLTRSVEANPRDAQAWYYLGRTKYSEGQFTLAIEAFEQCLKLEPHDVQAEGNVGLSYEALGKRAQAIQALENAIAWEREATAKDPQPFIELAHLYLEANQPEKAVPYLVQSNALFPNVSKAREELGKAYVLLHRLPEAQAELEKAVALEPETASLHFLLGQVYRQQGMLSKAQAEFDRYTAIQQAHSEIVSRQKR